MISSYSTIMDDTADRLRERLRAHLRFGALEAGLFDLEELERSCTASRIDLGILSQLDPAILSHTSGSTRSDCQGKRQRACDSEGSQEEGLLVDTVGVEPAAASAILVCVARYCALLDAHGVALQHFNAALELDRSSAGAARGVVQSLLAQHDRQAALERALHFWRESGRAVDAGNYDVQHNAFLLSYLADEQQPDAPADALDLLDAMRGVLHTPASSAVGSLCGSWLPKTLPAANLHEHEFVLDALRSSNEFCRRELEPLVVAARTHLLDELCDRRRADQIGIGEKSGVESSSQALLGSTRHQPAQTECSISEQMIAQLVGAAAIATHCYWCGFCLAETIEEEMSVQSMCALLEREILTCPLPEETLRVLCACSMYVDLSGITAVVRMVCDPQLDSKVRDQLTHTGLRPVWQLLETHVLSPRARERRAGLLRRATSLHVESERVASFYEHIVYPAWQQPQVFGMSSTSIADRMRRQFKMFEWPLGESSDQHRLLIAGAGSGHQIAQAIQCYAGLQIVGLDLSAPSLAFAHQKLFEVCPQEAASRVRLFVGDILKIGDQACPLGHFEMISAVGVLHHISAPKDALANLVAKLRPGGVLQIATYSTLGVASWRSCAARLIHRVAPDLVDGAGGLCRQPTPRELRAFRQTILSMEEMDLPPDEWAAREHLLRCSEFFTSTGCRDLLFHPSERTFTLLELKTLLQHAGCIPLGPFFATLESDAVARQAYETVLERSPYPCSLRTSGEGEPVRIGAQAASDEDQANLEIWHEVEKENPEIFGRMHIVYAQKRWR